MTITGTFFNETYYLAQNNDVRVGWFGSTLNHYIQFGASENRAPNSWFNAGEYARANTDLSSRNMTAAQLFDHYEDFGYKEGRAPSSTYANFNEALYISTYTDLTPGGITTLTALNHYLQYGASEGRTAKNDDLTTIVPATTGTTYTLTTGTDSGSKFTGGSGDDTFSGLSAATAEAATDTLNVLDILDGGAGTDRLDIVSSAANTGITHGAQISNIETIAFRGTAATGTVGTYAAGVGVTKIIANLSTQDLTATGLAAGGIYEVHGNTIVTNGITLAGYAAAATAGTLNITDGVTAGAITVSGTGLLSQTINSTGATNVIGALGLAATTTALTVNATTKLTTGAVTAAALTSITVTGAGDVALGTTIPASVTKITASAMTGALTATLANTAAQVVTLGSGNDVITTGGTLTTGSVDAGAGTADTLVLATIADANTAALGAKYTNFETLRLGVAGSIDMATTLTGLTGVQVVTGANSITNLTATQAANVGVYSAAAITTLTSTLQTSSGTSDALTIKFGTGLTTAAAGAMTVLTATGFETINLVEYGGATATVGANRTTTITGAIVDTSLATVNLTGRAFILTNIANANSNAVAWNASALTGDGDTTVLGLTASGALSPGSVVTGSAFVDNFTISGANNGSTYSGGAGNDLFTTTVSILASDGVNDTIIAGGTGTDKLTVSDAAVLTDNHFTNCTGLEALVLLGGANDVSVTGLGAAAKTAFADGIAVTDSATQSITQAYTWASGLYDKAVTLTHTFSGVGTVAAENQTITTGAGADVITVTGAAWTGAGAGVTQGVISISTGAGNDKITVTTGTLSTLADADSVIITAGTGADIISVTHVNGTDVTSAVFGDITFTIAAADSTTSAYDSITGFLKADGTRISDTLHFASVRISNGGAAYTAAAATGFSAAEFSVAASAAGLVTFTGTRAASATLAEQIAAVQSLVTTTAGDTVFWTNTAGTNTYVFNNNATSDSVVELIGVTGVTALITTNAATANAISII